MVTKRFGIAAASFVLIWALPVAAHHSFAAEFDGPRPSA